jgi:hypothetical protein
VFGVFTLNFFFFGIRFSVFASGSHVLCLLPSLLSYFVVTFFFCFVLIMLIWHALAAALSGMTGRTTHVLAASFAESSILLFREYTSALYTLCV